MSKHSIFIDNIAFAKNNEQLEGDLSLADCPRLAELLQTNDNQDSIANTSSHIRYTLQGSADVVGQHYLHLTLNATLRTTCQRCLGAMQLELALNFNYLIGDVAVDDVETIEIEGSDDFDLQQASSEMDVNKLIEDEIIMAMPIAPIHEKSCGAIITESGEKINPFAALKGLIKA